MPSKREIVEMALSWFRVFIAAILAQVAAGVYDWKELVRAAWCESGSPKTEDTVYFDFPDNVDRIQHTGICVKAMTDDEVLCIEGNTSSGIEGSQTNGGMVAIRLRKKSHVVGWGRPKYRKDSTPIVGKIVAHFDKKPKGSEDAEQA